MRAFRLPIIAAAVALALSGCMQTTYPVAGPGDLDTMAYGPLYNQPAAAGASGGGAIGALRNSFASTRAPSYAPAPVAYAAAPAPVAYDGGYQLDAGDKLRVVVYGQEGLTNTYAIDAAGSITMPLIGQVPARGRTPAGLAAEIGARLRRGYIREPSVAVEIEAYRPFFILGEVQAPGQYPYVPNMTVESAIAIAGGFSPRARRDVVTLTHSNAGGPSRTSVPLGTPLGPGDTVQVGERWF
ncbi:polysaccharide biosynthesis/export family protein [Bradyrhizobium sp. NP1]|uniref:polysaccharide biosynthesis/export family protein n=1 Tax=Bradyrhizobium sp. NP1 TaxID=3049772 RepID=UPI0025A5A41B|nr:polysaccharide biosynthesis/export family protein [Bradyrhizobium sp. NP1]WJR78247.1 polysaccharide biosynthesis/export family protein [Bradyrhizobium sp. NP1]